MVEKYFNLIECGPGWQNSLRAFDIDWVLFPPYFPIVNALYKGPRLENPFTPTIQY